MARPADGALMRDLERVEIEGYASVWNAAPGWLAASHGIEQAAVGGAHATCVRSLPGVRLVSHALGLPVERPVDEGDLEAIERFFFERGLPALIALPEGAAAEHQLERRGYRRDYAWVKFTRDVAPAAAVACELEVRPVPAVDAPRMGRLVTAAFDLPEELAPWFGAIVGARGWHCLGAYDGDELAATGSLFAAGNSGWLGFAATTPAQRGRGAQKALLAARVELGRELGLRVLATETGDLGDGRPDASHRNILGAGFGAAYRRPFWRRDP